MNGDVETIWIRGKWVNRIQGRHKLQADAARQGREIADTLGVEWFQKDLLGRIRERNTYGTDPRDTKG